MKTRIFSLGSILFLLLLVWAGRDVPFFTRGEAREAIAAKAMMITGDYVLPTVYGGEVPSKPPFSHWLMNLEANFFGEFTEASARFSSLLFASCFAIFFFLFLKGMKGQTLAWLSCFLLYTCLEWLRATRTCRVDMTLASSMAFSLLCLYRWQSLDFRTWRWPIFACIGLAAATLTKGPVALVLPGGIFGLYLLLEKRNFGLALGRCLLVFLPAAILASFWYFAAYAEAGEAFLNKVFAENFTRFADVNRVMPHKHSAFYLYGTLCIGFLPWAIPGILLFFQGRDSQNVRERLKRYWQEDPFRRFAIVVVLLTLLFFSIPSSKRSVYLLPLYPFLAFLLAEQLLAWWTSNNKALVRSFRALGVFFAFLALLGLALVFWMKVFGVERIQGSIRLAIEFYAKALTPRGVFEILLSVCGLFICVIATYLSFQKKSLGEVFQRVAISYLAFLTILLLLVFPKAAENLSAKEFLLAEKGRISSYNPLYSYGDSFFEGVFYLDKHFESFEWLPADEQEKIEDAYLFTFEKNLEKFREQFSEDYEIEEISRSKTSVWKPGRHLSLLRIQRKS